ncbi:MAG TPA: glycosyl hydrolase family 28 protein [Verrucomicrobiae bacterium]|nr:glycosyl hydrolase family 28 protein [Verrucomicrobiae bacterium]
MSELNPQVPMLSQNRKSHFQIKVTVLLLLAWTATSAFAAEPAGVFNVLDYGAKGDGTNNDTAAIQKTIDACAAGGGGQVLLPSGVFLSGALTLHSGIDFHLANGAVLKGSSNWRDYGHPGALLFAKDARNITISGNGIIDGNDRAVWQQLANEEAGGDVNKEGWWPQSFTGDWWPFGKKPGEPQKGGGRPMMMILIGCDRVRFHDFTLQNAPSWTVHLIGCDDVAIQSISIHNAWDVPNNDGIDLDHSRDVRIANCFIRAADDGIVIKNTPNFASYGASARITVIGCVIESRSSALKIDEVYTQPGARDIVFADCVVADSNRGLSIQSLDAGDIENVLFANITVQTGFQPHKWWGAAEPIHISHFPRTAATKLGRVRNIRFSNILCRGENGVFLMGWTNSPLENIVLDNVRVEIAKTSDVPGGFYDERPVGVFTNGIFEHKLAGIYARDVDGLTLTHTEVVWGQPKDKSYGKAFDESNVQNPELDHVSATIEAEARAQSNN